MRILEALRILETAVIECKLRCIDTPDVRAALDLLAPHCEPPRSIDGFRKHLIPGEEFGPTLEGQQQNLRVYFGSIHRSVRALVVERLGRLGTRYCRTKDPEIMAEIDRLNTELAKLPQEWVFKPNRPTL